MRPRLRLEQHTGSFSGRICSGKHGVGEAKQMGLGRYQMQMCPVCKHMQRVQKESK